MPSSRPSEIRCTGQPRRPSITILSKNASTAAPNLGTVAKNESHNHNPSSETQAAGRVDRYQLPTMILIVGREPSFGCAASPRQLHDGSLNVLFGAQQCAAYAISSFPLRRAGTRGAVCGASCCMPVAGPAVPPGDWLGSAKSGGTPTSVCLLRSVQSKTRSASTSAVSACSRAISACSRPRLSESSEQSAALAPAAGVAFAATETEKTETATSRTPNTAQTASRSHVRGST